MIEFSQREVTASAPGKIILTGEHFVVHGSIALAAAINRRATVKISQSTKPFSEIVSEGKRSSVFTDDGCFRVVKEVVKKTFEFYRQPKCNFQIEISSNIPQNSGLGSSAAIAVATSAALTAFVGNHLHKRAIWRLANFGEREVHGNPSGIDTWASIAGGAFLYNRKLGPKALRVSKPVQFFVVFSGKKRKTSDLISRVNEKRRISPATFAHLSKATSLLSLEMADALRKFDLEQTGSLIDLAQLSLAWMGISNGALDQILERLRGKDSYGAKITGAGGGGSVIALPIPQRARALSRMFASRYLSFLTTIPQEGLKWEGRLR